MEIEGHRCVVDANRKLSTEIEIKKLSNKYFKARGNLNSVFFQYFFLLESNESETN
jgi:hypothetical protein